MPEGDLIARTPSPRTRRSLEDDLHALGVQPGMILLVHSSLSSLGWVNGGPVAVVQALMDTTGPDGTLVVPTQTGAQSEPEHWSNPPVPQTWWREIRATMPGYDPAITPTRGMGQIADTIRIWPGTIRSAHPNVSFAARGPDAAHIIDGHSLEFSLGEGSPLARIYDLGGWVLLLGVPYANNTSFHLAEYRVPNPPLVYKEAPIAEGDEAVWHRWRDVDINSDPFDAIGADFERTGEVRIGQVGSATARLFPQHTAVDFAVQWLEEKIGSR